MTLSMRLLGLVVVFGVLSCQEKPAPASDEPSPPPSNAPPATARRIESAPNDAPCRAAATAARPGVRWTSDFGLNGDLNFDGAEDLVVWGTEDDSLFVVSIVECPQRKPGRVWIIPLRARPAFGTLDLDVSLVSPAFGQGFLEENCMGAETTAECRQLAALNARLEAAHQRGGRGLQIGVPDRHSIHLHWDSDSSRFVMWGL